MIIVVLLEHSKLVILFEILSHFFSFCLILSASEKYAVKHKMENKRTLIWIILENRLPLPHQTFFVAVEC